MRTFVIFFALVTLSLASCAREGIENPPVDTVTESTPTESVILPAEVQDVLATPAADSGSESEAATGSGSSGSGVSVTSTSGSLSIQSGTLSAGDSQGVITTIERSDTGASAGDTTISTIR